MGSKPPNIERNLKSRAGWNKFNTVNFRDQDVRWRQRCSNFERAVILLREPLARPLSDLSSLEKEGTIQRFEMTTELAWKTLKDYLQAQGQTVQPITPKAVVKAAYAAEIIGDGQLWVDLLDLRNLLSHTYSESTLEPAILAIDRRFMPAFEELLSWFLRLK